MDRLEWRKTGSLSDKCVPLADKGGYLPFRGLCTTYHPVEFRRIAQGKAHYRGDALGPGVGDTPDGRLVFLERLRVFCDSLLAVEVFSRGAAVVVVMFCCTLALLICPAVTGRVSGPVPAVTPPLPVPRPLPAVGPVVPTPVICALTTKHITATLKIEITLVQTILGKFIDIAPLFYSGSRHYARETAQACSWSSHERNILRVGLIFRRG